MTEEEKREIHRRATQLVREGNHSPDGLCVASVKNVTSRRWFVGVWSSRVEDGVGADAKLLFMAPVEANDTTEFDCRDGVEAVLTKLRQAMVLDELANA